MPEKPKLREQPGDAISHAADEAMRRADEVLREHGSEAKLIFICIDALPGTLPEREDQVVAVHSPDGDVDARDVFAMLAVHLTAVGKAIGMRVDLLPVDKPMGGEG